MSFVSSAKRGRISLQAACALLGEREYSERKETEQGKQPSTSKCAMTAGGPGGSLSVMRKHEAGWEWRSALQSKDHPEWAHARGSVLLWT